MSAYQKEFHQAHELEYTPIRPLGELSNFVVDTLPAALREVHTGQIPAQMLVMHAEDLVAQSVTEDPTDLDTHDRDLQLLDLIFLRTGIVHTGGIPGIRLQTAVNRMAQAAQRPPVLTYEDVILTNPLNSDPRRFTSGETGKVELTFYKDHKEIEGRLDVAISGLTSARKGILGTSNNDPEAATSFARQQLTQVVNQVANLRHMPPGTFEQFRGYFSSDPFVKGAKGPSGAFTAGIPIVELILAGDHLPEDYLDYLDTNSIFFPRSGQERIHIERENASQGLTLVTLAERTRSTGFQEELTKVSDTLRKFRGMHRGAVLDQIPQALRGTVTGTAGETDVSKFLGQRMQMKHGIERT